MYEITMYRGDSETITVFVPIATGNLTPKDLTNYVMTMTVKSSPTDAVNVMQKTATISAPATGVGVISITILDSTITPATYYYDIEIYNSITFDKKTITGPTKFTILQDLTT